MCETSKQQKTMPYTVSSLPIEAKRKKVCSKLTQRESNYTSQRHVQSNASNLCRMIIIYKTALHAQSVIRKFLFSAFTQLNQTTKIHNEFKKMHQAPSSKHLNFDFQAPVMVNYISTPENCNEVQFSNKNVRRVLINFLTY